MSSVFDFPSGELDLATGLVLMPGGSGLSDLVAAGWTPLGSRNGLPDAWRAKSPNLERTLCS